MTEEKKDFSEAENIIAPDGAFCDSPGGKADTGGGASVGYGTAGTGNNAERAPECSGEVMEHASDKAAGIKDGDGMAGSMEKESEGAASDGKKLPPPSDGQNGGVFYSAEEVRALLQSEGDRRVSGARRKWEKETEEAIAGEASKRAAELTASLEAERERLCAELEGERERSRQRERELEIVRLLGERDLPATLLPLIMPARDCAEAVGALADTVAVLASRETKRRLSSDAPKAAEKGIKFTSEELRTIPVARLQEMLGAQ